MGLDVSHGCWLGGYERFMRWRSAVAKAAGMPPLQWMEGFYAHADITSEDAKRTINAMGFAPESTWARDLLTAFYYPNNLPILWSALRPSPLHLLLHHSDCDGEIRWKDCAAIADTLEALLDVIPRTVDGGAGDELRSQTRDFIDGLRLAARQKENVEFC